MKSLGTTLPFLDHGSQPLQMGRLVVNHNFDRELLRHGNCAEYLFSIPRQQFDGTQKLRSGVGRKDGRRPNAGAALSLARA